MADLGFWAIAADDPGHLALVEADGRETAAGDLLAASNRLARGLQAVGLQKGDVVAALLPNEREMVELALGATQIGLYLTPINYHLTGPEVAYIVDNSEAKVFVTSDRYADVATKAVDELGFDEKSRYSVGAVDGFRSFDELKDASADAPDNRTAGAAMHYTSGTTGKPKGVRRTHPRARRALPLHHVAHGADHVPPHARPAHRDQGQVRRVVVAARHPCRRPLPSRDQEAHARVVGAGHLRVLRGHRRRGHV